jgi:exonuclease SbcD
VSSPIKIVHAADLHLDSPLRGLPAYPKAPLDAFRRATRRALRRLVALCLQEDAAALLLAGDLVDGSGRDHKTGLFLVRQLLRLHDAGIPVLSVRGNHDAASRVVKNVLWPGNVVELGLDGPETVVLEGAGLAVHGQSYLRPATYEDLARSYPAPISALANVGVLHTSAEGRRGHDPYAPCSRSGLLARGYDYWALGHVHAREVLAQAPWVVFCGNLQGRSPREVGPKGATLITVVQGRVAAVEHRPLDVVRYTDCAVDVSRHCRLDEVLDGVAVVFRQLARQQPDLGWAVRLVLQGSAGVGCTISHGAAYRQDAVRDVAASVGGAGIWVTQIWATIEGELAADFRLDAPGPHCELV